MLFIPNLNEHDLQLGGFYSQQTSQTANQPTKQPAHETIHPEIPTSLGPGAGGPKAIGYFTYFRPRNQLPRPQAIKVEVVKLNI